MGMGARLAELVREKDRVAADLSRINIEIADLIEKIDGPEAPVVPAVSANRKPGPPPKPVKKAAPKAKARKVSKPRKQNKKTTDQVNAIAAAGGSVTAAGYADMLKIETPAAKRRLDRFTAQGLLVKTGDSYAVKGQEATGDASSSQDQTA